jgi:hypothetical protein
VAVGIYDGMHSPSFGGDKRKEFLGLAPGVHHKGITAAIGNNIAILLPAAVHESGDL